MKEGFLDVPKKLSDRELYHLLDVNIARGNYVFKKHARQRQKDRNISDAEVIQVLEGRSGRRRHRNKLKDSYEAGKEAWKYCREGINPDNNKLRIIISFEEGVIPIITVMWIN